MNSQNKLGYCLQQFFLLKTGIHTILSGEQLDSHVKNIIKEIPFCVKEEDVITYINTLNDRIDLARKNENLIDFGGMEKYTHIAIYDFVIRYRNNFWPDWIQMNPLLFFCDRKIFDMFGVDVYETYDIIDKIYGSK